MNHRYIQRGRRSARGRTSQEANQPGTGGESASGRMSQEANKLRGERARSWISQGVNEPEGEQARGEPAKGRKSHNSLLAAAKLPDALIICFVTTLL